MYVNLTWTLEDPTTGEIEWHDAPYQIKSPSFSPQVDLSGNSMPAGEYTVDVILPEPLPGDLAACDLYDALDQLWCAWPIRTSQYITETCLRITCSSWLRRLEHRELEAVMYEGETAENAVATCFGQAYASHYTLADDLKNRTISGYCPAQTARDRLLWLLFVLGAYTQDVYRDDVLITTVDDNATLIPLDKTFSRPSEEQADWVTGLKITTYTFRQAATEEEWQADDSSYMFPLPWLATEQIVELANPLAPSTAQPHVVEMDGIYLINPNNVSDIAARLAKYWFNPAEVTLDCINNRAYKPGDMVTAYVTPERLVTGYIEQASFSFGKQARSTLKLVGAEAIDGAKLEISYTYQGGVIGRQTYYLPVGVTYTIQNNYIDRIYQNRRYIYRPQSETVTGTMVDGGLNVDQPCDLALEYRDERLYVYSVDSIVKQGDSGTYTGVIT